MEQKAKIEVIRFTKYTTIKFCSFLKFILKGFTE
jgi:hypothetical protein